MDDTDDVRTSRTGPEVGQDLRSTRGVTTDTGPTHLSQSLQPVVDYRGWPHLDVTMATPIHHSATVELGVFRRDERSFAAVDLITKLTC